MNERGSTLFLTTVMLLTGLVMLGGLFAWVTTDKIAVESAIQSNKAHYIAEAGITQAITHLNADPTWRNGLHSVPFGEGNYTVTITIDDKYAQVTFTPSASQPETQPETQPESTLSPPKKIPRYITIISKSTVSSSNKSQVKIVYDVKDKKIISWSE